MAWRFCANSGMRARGLGLEIERDHRALEHGLVGLGAGEQQMIAVDGHRPDADVGSWDSKRWSLL